MTQPETLCAECGRTFDSNVEHHGEDSPAAMGEIRKHTFKPETTDAEKLVVDLKEQADLLQETQEAPGAEFDLWIAPELLREAATTISDLRAEVRIQQAYRKEADESTAYWEVKAAELRAEVKMRAESQGMAALAIDSLTERAEKAEAQVTALQVALAYALDTIEDCCEPPPMADIKMAELRALTTDTNKESRDE